LTHPSDCPLEVRGVRVVRDCLHGIQEGRLLVFIAAALDLDV
jgi:hypothetical protein